VSRSGTLGGSSPPAATPNGGARPLHVSGTVHIDAGDDRFVVRGEGDTLSVDADSLGALRRLRKNVDRLTRYAGLAGAGSLGKELLVQRGRVRIAARVRGVSIAEVSEGSGRTRVKPWNSLRSVFGASERDRYKGD